MENIKKFFGKITKRQWLIILAAVVVVIAVIVAVVVINNNNDKKDSAQPEEEKVIINDSSDIIKEGTYEGLTINNIILQSQGDFSTFTATVTNSTDAPIDVKDFDIVLKNGDNVIATLYGYLGEEAMAAGESRDITASIGVALTKDTVNNVEYTAHTTE